MFSNDYDDDGDDDRMQDLLLIKRIIKISGEQVWVGSAKAGIELSQAKDKNKRAMVNTPENCSHISLPLYDRMK